MFVKWYAKKIFPIVVKMQDPNNIGKIKHNTREYVTWPGLHQIAWDLITATRFRD